MSEETKLSPVPDERGLIPGNHGGRIMPPWNSDTSRVATAKRLQKAEAEARRALTRVAGSYSPEIEAMIAKHDRRMTAQIAAWGKVVEAQSELALDPAAYGTTQAAKFVGSATGFLQSYSGRQAAGAGPSTGGVTIHIDADAARLLLAELRASRGQDRPAPGSIGSGGVIGPAPGDKGGT